MSNYLPFIYQVNVYHPKLKSYNLIVTLNLAGMFLFLKVK